MHPFIGSDFSSDGTRLVTVTDDTTVRVWLVDEARALTVKAVSAATDVAFDPTGRFVVVGSELGSIAMVAAGGTGDPIVFRGHGEWIGDLGFSGDGSRLVSAANDGTFRVWRISWRELLRVHPGSDHDVSRPGAPAGAPRRCCANGTGGLRGLPGEPWPHATHTASSMRAGSRT